MKIPVYNLEAEKTGEVEVSDKIYAIKPTKHLLAEAVRVQLSNARKGLANTKTRGEVSGGGKKPWKQKGTGRARVGSIRSPIWRHGGVTFGPNSDRNWELKMNKKAKMKALFMALSDKAGNGNFIVVDSLSIEPKTKEFVKVYGKFAEKIKDFGKKQLIVVENANSPIARASKNIKAIIHSRPTSLNIVDVLKASSIILEKGSLAIIEKTYLKEVASKK